MLMITCLVGVICALAAARPSHTEADVPRMHLEEVLGRTICPLKVVVDEDPLRLPRRIKFMTCDREAMVARRWPAACSQQRTVLEYRAQCVEVFDNVVVQFLPRAGADVRSATRHVVPVPVGCTCVLLDTTTPIDDD